MTDRIVELDDLIGREASRTALDFFQRYAQEDAPKRSTSGGIFFPILWLEQFTNEEREEARERETLARLKAKYEPEAPS